MLMTAGQTSAQTTMGLRECMQYAVENSTKIAVEDERLSQQSIERRDALLNAFTPSVSASSSVTYSSDASPTPRPICIPRSKPFRTVINSTAR